MGKLDFSKLYNKHFLVLAGNGLISIVGFATTMLLFRALSITAIGMFFFMQGIVVLIEAGRYGFLSTATVKFYAGATPERANTVIGSVWFLTLSFTGIVVAINLLALPLLLIIDNEQAILCIKWIGISVLSTMAADITFWRLQALERYGAVLLYRLLNSTLTILVYAVLLFLHKMTLENVIFFNIATNFIASFTGIFLNISGITNLVNKSKACIREIVHFGKYTFGTTLVSSLLGNADTFILNFILGPAAVAIYTLAVKLMALIEMPLRTLATTGMSEMAIFFNNDNIHGVTYILKKYSGMLTMLFIPVAIFAVLVADYAVRLLGGHDFGGDAGMQAANIYRLFMIMSLIYPIDRFNGLALDIIHQTKTNFYKVILMLTIKITTGLALTYMLQNIYGVVISNYLMTFAAIAYGHHHLRKHLDYTIGGIIKTGYAETKLIIQKTLKLNVKPQ